MTAFAPIANAPVATQQIELTLAALADAWNRHDMDAFAALFSEKADFVNVVGMHWHGREEIRLRHSAMHRGMFRKSRVEALETSIRFLTPTHAVVHFTSQMTGHEPPAEWHVPAVRQTRMVLVLEESGGKWMITTAQNTEVQDFAQPE